MNPAQMPSRQTLEEVPAKVIKFLIAVGQNIAIRIALAARGYTDKDHQYAWTLLGKLAVILPPGAPVNVDHEVRKAVTELDVWDNEHFPCIQAPLDRLHPAQSEFVFEALEPKQGAESVVAVATLLDRLDALEKSPDRKATRKEDHAALATLAARGYTPEERARLRALVKKAQSAGPVAQPLSDDERQQILYDLYMWLNDWGTVAKAAVKRKDYLIQMGFATRRRAKKTQKKAPEPEKKAPEPEKKPGTRNEGTPPP